MLQYEMLWGSYIEQCVDARLLPSLNEMNRASERMVAWAIFPSQGCGEGIAELVHEAEANGKQGMRVRAEQVKLLIQCGFQVEFRLTQGWLASMGGQGLGQPV